MSTIVCQFRDAPFRRDVRVAGGDGHRDPLSIQLNDAALDLTDVTWALRISDHPGGAASVTGAAVADWTESGVYLDSASDGQVTVWVAETDTTALGAGEYWYELVATFPGDHSLLPSLTKTLIAGAFRVVQDVA